MRLGAPDATGRQAPELIEGSDYVEGADIVIKALQRCGSFLRGRLGREMEMKSIPRLRFMKDESFDTAEEMTRLLQDPKVQQDLEK